MRQWKIIDKKLYLQTWKLPTLGPEDVKIEVKAVGVNRADLLQVKGLYPAPEGFDSSVPGLEYAGVIVEQGEKVPNSYLGLKVMGLIPSAAYSEQLIVHHRETLAIPEGISFEQAATLPEGFLTAYRALFIEGQIKVGQWCLIRPATAAVGMAAVQLVRAVGARSVGSSRHQAHWHEGSFSSPDAWVLEESLVSDIQKICGQQLSLVMDMVGPHWNSLVQALKLDGRIVSVGVMAGIETELNLFQFLMKRIKVQAMTMRSQPLEERILMAKAFNEQLAPLFQQQKLQALPHKAFAFEQAPEAHQDMLAGTWHGKRVLVLD